MDEFEKREVTWQSLRRQKLTAAAAAAALSSRHKSIDLFKITHLLKNPDPLIREGAVKSIAQIGGSTAAQSIIPCLMDPDARVRIAACNTLGRMRSHQARSSLIDALCDREPGVCCAAASALAAMGDKIGLAHVMKYLCVAGRHQRQALRCLNVITGQNFPVNDHGLRQAINWVKERKKRFKQKS